MDGYIGRIRRAVAELSLKARSALLRDPNDEHRFVNSARSFSLDELGGATRGALVEGGNQRRCTMLAPRSCALGGSEARSGFSI